MPPAPLLLSLVGSPFELGFKIFIFYSHLKLNRKKKYTSYSCVKVWELSIECLWMLKSILKMLYTS